MSWLDQRTPQEVAAVRHISVFYWNLDWAHDALAAMVERCVNLKTLHVELWRSMDKNSAGAWAIMKLRKVKLTFDKKRHSSRTMAWDVGLWLEGVVHWIVIAFPFDFKEELFLRRNLFRCIKKRRWPGHTH